MDDKEFTKIQTSQEEIPAHHGGKKHKFGSVQTIRGTFAKQRCTGLNYPAMGTPPTGERKAVSAWLPQW